MRVSTVFSNIRDILFPPLCVLCNEPFAQGNNWLCAGCLQSLEKNLENRFPCPRCSHNQKLENCTCTIAWDHYFERAFSFFDFDETVQHCAHHIKYKGKKGLAWYLGKQYAYTIPEEMVLHSDLIVPVPLHFFRKMKRGYNQADYFARGMAEGLLFKLPLLHNGLVRVRNTHTQTKLNKAQRQKNLEQAFAINPRHQEQIQGKNIILVDDVVTTGATADICTKVLLDAGAAMVRVISLART
jgi:ComF family protein